MSETMCQYTSHTMIQMNVNAKKTSVGCVLKLLLFECIEMRKAKLESKRFDIQYNCTRKKCCMYSDWGAMRVRRARDVFSTTRTHTHTHSKYIHTYKHVCYTHAHTKRSKSTLALSFALFFSSFSPTTSVIHPK